jgi:hypothetical protein
MYIYIRIIFEIVNLKYKIKIRIWLEYLNLEKERERRARRALIRVFGPFRLSLRAAHHLLMR